MLELVEVQPLSGYRVRLRYADGVAGVVDLSHLAGKGVFQLWDDPKAFERVSIGSSGEVRWSEEVDLCADALYLQITGKQPEEVFPALSKVAADA
jgi:hypothetical protein